jgi:integrase/recombinase XerD
MFKKIFERANAINRHQSAPLLKERLQYLTYWQNHGATMYTLRKAAQYLLGVIHCLDLTEKRIVKAQEIEIASEKWAKRNLRISTKRYGKYSLSAKKKFLCEATNWLKMLGWLDIPQKKYTEYAIFIDTYLNYAQKEQGLSKQTIKGKRIQLNDFLQNLYKRKIQLNLLKINHVDAVLKDKGCIDGYARNSLQTYGTSIRSFLRYSEQQGWSKKGLADFIRTPRVYQDEKLPSSPDWNDIQRLLATTEGDHSTNIRDRAILMLLIVYGLRRGEIANLLLDNLDWQNNKLHIQQSKTKRMNTLPLSETVGQEIAKYLKKVRPNWHPSRNVFFEMRAPYHPLSSGAIYQIVKRRFKSLNVQIKHYGPHSLRHACATRLINEGIPLKEISDYLGHQDQEATRIYAKVNLTGLCKIAEFDLGELI